MWKQLKTLIAGSLLLGAALVPAQAADVVLKFAHEAPETAIKGRTATLFAELVEKYTNGSVKVEVYPGGQLVPTVEEIRAAARGQVDIIAPYTSYLASINDLWNLFYQPMLFKSPEKAMEIFAGEIGQELLGKLDDRGLKGLAIWHDGPIYAFTTGEPPSDPAALKGQKVRVAPSKPQEMLLEKVGATPVGMPGTEVFLALQQGAVTGVVTTPTFAAPSGWGEVLKSMTRGALWGEGGYGVSMNKRKWESLTAEQQEGIVKAIKEATAWNASEALANIAKSEKTLEAAGMTITDATDEQKAAWTVLAKDVWAAQSDEVKALITRVQEAQK